MANASTKEKGFFEADNDIKRVDMKLIMVKVLTIIINAAGLIACTSVTAIDKKNGEKTSLSSTVPVFFVDEYTNVYSLPARFYSHQIQVWYLYTVAFVFLTLYSLLTFCHVVAHSLMKKGSKTASSFGWFQTLYLLTEFGNKNIHFYRIWNNAIVIAIITPAVLISLKYDSIVSLASLFGVVLYAIGGLGIHESMYGWFDSRKTGDLRTNVDLTDQEILQWRFAYFNFFLHTAYVLTPLILFWCIALNNDFPAVGAYYWTLHTFYLFFLFTYVAPLLFTSWTKKMMWSYIAPNELLSELWIAVVVAICFAMTVKMYQSNFLADYGL